jgi:GNAT superfamily N-acetyltransferase
MGKSRKSSQSTEASIDVVVRSAKREDARVIAKLARELNAHEGDPERHFTEKVILRDSFGRTPQFKCLLVEVSGKIVGYALLLEAYETGWAARGLYLNDLYVTARARRKGAGRALMAACAAEARRREKTYLWWASKIGNKKAHAFYKNVGATHEPVIAHALTFDKFDALAKEGRARRSPAKKDMRNEMKHVIPLGVYK